MLVTVRRLDRCANHKCPNRAGEGSFSIIDIDVEVLKNAPSASRTISIAMCTPCSTAFLEAFAPKAGA